MPLFYIKVVNYVSSHFVNYVTTLYKLFRPRAFKERPTDKQNLIRCKQILTPTENPPAFVLFCSINWNSTIYTRITTFLLLRHQWRLHLFFHLYHIVKDLLQILLLLRTHFFQYKIACQKTQNRPPCNPNLNQPL